MLSEELSRYQRKLPIEHKHKQENKWNFYNHLITMSAFNLPEGIKCNERSKPVPNGLILSVLWKPLVKPSQPVLY